MAQDPARETTGAAVTEMHAVSGRRGGAASGWAIAIVLILALFAGLYLLTHPEGANAATDTHAGAVVEATGVVTTY